MKRKFTIWLTLVFATLFLGLVVALLLSNAAGTKIKLVVAQEEPAKQNTTYALVVERFWNRSGSVYGSKDIWEIYGVKDFELNDDYIVERFWYSPIVDEVMDRWMNRGNEKITYGDRLFAEGVERALVDIPGCPLILTTDKPYRRMAEDRWWSLIVQHEREETYSRDMLRCERVFLNELTQDLVENLDDEIRALEDELKQLEKDGKLWAAVFRILEGYSELRDLATEGQFDIALLRLDSLLSWVTEETDVDLWEPIDYAMLEPGSASPLDLPELSATALSSSPTAAQTE